MLDYEINGEIFIADECMDCSFSHTDDWFGEWYCERRECKYSKKKQLLIIEKDRRELMEEENDKDNQEHNG